MYKAVAIVALLVAAVITLSVSASASGPSQEPRAETLRFLAVETGKENYIDLGERGDSIGDIVMFTEILRAGGRIAGHTEIHCTFAGPESARCNGTIFLRNGKLEAGGALHFRKISRLPILGGTGAYAGARGQLEFTEAGNTRSRYLVRLVG
jgi:hypothetical protein